MCKYESEYFDSEKKERYRFKCKEKEMKDGFCIFHHPEFWMEQPQRVAKEFYKKVEWAERNREELLCIGYHLSDISLSKRFTVPINFSGSTFNNADFRGTLFDSKLDFSGVKFKTNVDFCGVTFNEAYFHGASFHDANFHVAIFNKKTSFVNVIFYEKVNFSNAIFKEKADFSGSSFNMTADFSNAKFDKVQFFDARFNKEGIFKNTIFESKAYFSDAIFNKANFRGSLFNEGIFPRATFNEADFTAANLIEASFSLSTFNKADFTAATLAEAWFNGAIFNGEVFFFNLKKIKDNNTEYGSAPIIFFQSVTLNKPEKVHFNGFDLSNTSFIYTEISKIDIGERVQWKAHKKYIDERTADMGKVPYEVVGTVYRRIRQNLESKLRYFEAGRFFIAEMETKRKNVTTKNSVLRWLRLNIFSALAWYKYFCNYGESYKRLIPWIVCTPIMASLLTVLIDGLPSLTQWFMSSFDIAIISDSLQNFQESFLEHMRIYLLAFFQLRSENMKELIVRLFGLLFVGQLYISLRRQFERRYQK